MMLCIYHDGCVDGWCSAYLVQLAYPETGLHPAVYGQPPPDVKGQDVIIVDFSYPRSTLLKMKEEANSLVVLDHHKTAQADLEGLDFCKFDMNQSGAVLTYYYLVMGTHMPINNRLKKLCDYVQDRDLWKWELPYSKEVSAWISSFGFNKFDWQHIVNAMFDLTGEPLIQGTAILRYKEQAIQRILKDAYMYTYKGDIVWCVNTSIHQSEVANELAKRADCPFGIAWYVDPERKLRVSLRSIEGRADVSEIAKTNGGGGHKRAAGFTLDATLSFDMQ